MEVPDNLKEVPDYLKDVLGYFKDINDYLNKIDLKYYYIAAGIGLTTVVLYHRYLRIKRPPGTPPGLPSWPIVGSLPYLKNPQQLHKELTALGDTYGKVCSLYMGNTFVVVLNDYESVKECFVSKGSDTSARPYDERQKIVFVDYPIMSISNHSFSEEWKAQRNLAITILRDLGWGKQSIVARIGAEAGHLVEAMKNTRGQPFDPYELLSVSVSNIICSLLFGRRFDHNDAQFRLMQKNSDDLFECLNLGIGGAMIPMLRIMPAYRRVKEQLKRAVKNLNEFHNQQLDECEQRLKDGEEPIDFVSRYKQEVAKIKSGNSRISESWLNGIISDFFLAGSETTTTTLRWSLLFLASRKDIQEKIHQELDSQFDKGHVFAIEDKAKLQYLEAFMMEVLRYNPVAPLGLIHVPVTDIKIGGYNIPQGCMIWPNLYAVCHDPENWHNPEDFTPERFLDANGQTVKKDEWIPFSMGRRTCLGEQLAKQELFIFLASVVHNFNIAPEGDISQAFEGIMKITLQPGPYQIKLTPRQ